MQTRGIPVDKIIRLYDTFFVHSIAPFFVPAENSLLYDTVTWEEKLDIVLALQPTLSGSTICANETKRHLWAQMGVILNGGNVTNAWFQDHGTKARNLQERDAEGVIYMEDLEQRIARAIRRENNPHWYNEFVIENPEICGFYVCQEKESVKHEGIVSEEEIMRKIESVGIPLYLLKQGRLYHAGFNAGKIVAEGEIRPEEILERKWKLEEERKKAILQGIMENSSFRLDKIDIVESFYYGGFSAGEETYILLAAKEYPEKMQGERSNIAEFFWRGGGSEYFAFGDKLFVKRYNKDILPWKRKTSTSYVPKYAERSKRERRLKLIPEHINDTFENPEEYLKCVGDEVIPSLTKRYQETGDVFFYHQLTCFGYHLYGFAEMARSKGDQKNADEAERIAAEIIAKEVCDEVITKRRGVRGAVKITEEDLRGLGYEA